MISANYYGAINPSENTTVKPLWTKTFKDATEMEKAKGFDAPKQSSNRSMNPMQPTGKAVIRDHSELDDLVWPESGHKGNPETLAAWDKSGKPALFVPNHANIKELAWDQSGHTGAPETLAVFDQNGNAVSLSPESIGLPPPADAKGLVIVSDGEKWVVKSMVGTIEGESASSMLYWNESTQTFQLCPITNRPGMILSLNGSIYNAVYSEEENDAKDAFMVWAANEGLSGIIPLAGTDSILFSQKNGNFKVRRFPNDQDCVMTHEDSIDGRVFRIRKLETITVMLSNGTARTVRVLGDLILM